MVLLIVRINRKKHAAQFDLILVHYNFLKNTKAAKKTLK